ncbi:MFS transporter [Streptomyces sp. NPDC051776]|uniref:MFS transporter n=1 Tax=Streptomyces sp. NPDC051776 TaxID=3155414 RepID=UPI0034274854
MGTDSPAPHDAPEPPTALTTRHRRKVATVAALASSLEWYDYFVFAVAGALVFGPQFFPSDRPVTGVLASFATFAVGFAARPVGGIVAGHLGDRHGRKPMLVWALVLMGLATTAIGALPSYGTIGVAAPVLLVILRIVQGLALGAQWGAAMLMTTEYAPPGKRGLYGSLVQMGVPIGLVVANTLFLVSSAAMSNDAFSSWGWRLPFLCGILVLVLARYVHRHAEETPEFREAERELAVEEKLHSPLRTVLRHHLGTVLLAGGSLAVNAATFYIIVTGVLDYATRELGMARNSVLAVSLLVNVTQLALIPTAAAVSDRVGRLRIYAIGAFGVVAWAVPMFLLIDTGSLALLGIGIFIASCFVSIMYGPQAALFAELFTTGMRYTGASLGYQLAAVLGGGLAPFVMVLLLEETGTSMSVAAYIIGLGLIALASIAVLARRGAVPRPHGTG